jgi:hypothetical protein
VTSELVNKQRVIILKNLDVEDYSGEIFLFAEPRTDSNVDCLLKSKPDTTILFDPLSDTALSLSKWYSTEYDSLTVRYRTVPSANPYDARDQIYTLTYEMVKSAIEEKAAEEAKTPVQKRKQFSPSKRLPRRTPMVALSDDCSYLLCRKMVMMLSSVSKRMHIL